jgi:hypothetical protein
MPHHRLILMLVLMLTVFLTAAYADDAQPLPVGDSRHLLALLRYVPATSQVTQSYVSYGDFRAAEAARMGVPRYSNFAAFLNDSTDLSEVWLASIPLGGYQALLVDLLLLSTTDMSSVVGFDFFDIDRTLQFSQPAALGIVVQGSFSPSAVDTAHAARGYTRDDRDGYTLWCGAVGCENGSQLNILNRDPLNIFGGDLGREFPVALIEQTGVIISSSDLATVINSAGGAQPTLADDVTYQMAIEALTEFDGGLLRSAMLIPPALLNPSEIDLSRLLPSGATAEQIAEAQAQLVKTYGNLPPYSLVFFADMATHDDQTAVVGLVYDSRANAEAAAKVLAARLEVAEISWARRSWQEMLDQREMTLSDVILYQRQDSDMAVLLLPFRYPAPLNSMPGSSRAQTAGLGYRLLLEGFWSDDLEWLAYDLAF